ncbi:hypothetical protein GD1_85 [Paraglaciecola Antarctic GD virus 1]|nr:hypothetical protein GD1_85 [Paraglaciecola Antarctic GD virus 1]
MYLKNQTVIDRANYFIRNLSKKYGCVDNTGGVNVSIKCDDHLMERMDERGIDKSVFERIVTRLVKHKICEIIYLIEMGHYRINLIGQDDHLIGVHGRITQNGNYYVYLRTIYKIRNRKNRQREIDSVEIEMEINK